MFLSACFSAPLTANVPCTPHQTPAGLAAKGRSYTADTVNPVHTRTAGVTDLRYHAVRQKKRCRC